jgi:hypothetical protein
MAVELVLIFLSTAIASSDPITKSEMVRNFLYSLHGSWLADGDSEKRGHFNINPIETPSPKEFVTKILRAPAHYQQKALHHALSGYRKETLIIIENAHNALGSGTTFLLSLLEMTRALESDFTGVKLLITSQPRVELKQPLVNVVNIERDSERQGRFKITHSREGLTNGFLA